MKRAIIFIFLISTITISGTCKKNSPDCHFSYTIKNASDSDIYFIWSRDSALISLSYNPASSASTYKIKANTEMKNIHRTCFENEILSSLSKKLYIFIFDAYTLETATWDSVKRFNIVEKRYNLTKEQLDRAGWVINYP